MSKPEFTPPTALGRLKQGEKNTRVYSQRAYIENGNTSLLKSENFQKFINTAITLAFLIGSFSIFNEIIHYRDPVLDLPTPTVTTTPFSQQDLETQAVVFQTSIAGSATLGAIETEQQAGRNALNALLTKAVASEVYVIPDLVTQIP